jgi:hypothetical protein
MRLLCFALLSPLFIGCAQSAVKVDSVPAGADVYLSYDAGQAVKIGQTPLTLTDDQVQNKQGGYATVEIRKEGFLPESLLVPTSYLGSEVKIPSKLEENKMSLQCHDQTVAMQKLARGTASVQHHIGSAKFNEALNQINPLINEFPNVSVLHDLKGNILYLTKDLMGALGSYDRSYQLDPSNTDTQRIRTRIRGILGERAPNERRGE